MFGSAQGQFDWRHHVPGRTAWTNDVHQRRIGNFSTLPRIVRYVVKECFIYTTPAQVDYCFRNLAELLSGVDYREPVCYPSSVPAAVSGAMGSIDQAQQQQLATIATTATASPAQPNPILQPPPLPPPSPTPPVGEMILRGIQSPFAGLAKLLNQYNLFG